MRESRLSSASFACTQHQPIPRSFSVKARNKGDIWVAAVFSNHHQFLTSKKCYFCKSLASSISVLPSRTNHLHPFPFFKFKSKLAQTLLWPPLQSPLNQNPGSFPWIHDLSLREHHVPSPSRQAGVPIQPFLGKLSTDYIPVQPL